MPVAEKPRTTRNNRKPPKLYGPAEFRAELWRRYGITLHENTPAQKARDGFIGHKYGTRWLFTEADIERLSARILDTTDPDHPLSPEEAAAELSRMYQRTIKENSVKYWARRVPVIGTKVSRPNTGVMRWSFGTQDLYRLFSLLGHATSSYDATRNISDSHIKEVFNNDPFAARRVTVEDIRRAARGRGLGRSDSTTPTMYFNDHEMRILWFGLDRGRTDELRTATTYLAKRVLETDPRNAGGETVLIPQVYETATAHGLGEAIDGKLYFNDRELTALAEAFFRGE